MYSDAALVLRAFRIPWGIIGRKEVLGQLRGSCVIQVTFGILTANGEAQLER
jgi:hypothetical protein